MKKFLCVATLLLGISPCALAQAPSEKVPARASDQGSARGVIHSNERGNERAADRATETPQKTAAQMRRVLVNCNDGTRHIARVCRRHGGIARDQSAAQ